MRQAGVACELITVEGGGHGMAGWRAPGMQHWKTDMVAWLEKTMPVR
jgi:hypothetical protein